MAWTRRQQIAFHKAVKAAAWSDRQRYMAMLHAGCPIMRCDAPLDKKEGQRRPSVHHPRNSNDAFERVMAIAEAEASARGAGHLVPKPAKFPTWRAASAKQTDRTIRKIRAVWGELAAKIPAVFGGGDAALDGFAQRMTSRDDAGLPIMRPTRLGDVDAGQAYRILEGLKGWGGREMHKRGLTPVTFKPHKRRGPDTIDYDRRLAAEQIEHHEARRRRREEVAA